MRQVANSPELHKQKKSSYLRRPYICIFIALLSIQLFIFSVTRITTSAVCPAGRIYAYDLPSLFNHDFLLRHCFRNRQCGVAVNQGLGLPAADLRRLLPSNLSESWFRTNQLGLELIFHRRILQHKCRTLEAESAAAFYIPFYAGLALENYFWIKDPAKREWQGEELLQWVQRQKPWMKSNGSDHFIAIGRVAWDFTTDTAQLWPRAMQRVTRVIVEKDPWDHRDIAVPYPTGFHPGTKQVVNNWQDFVRGYNRFTLFTLVPSLISNDFRGLLLSYCSDESLSCRVVDGAAEYSVTLEAFLGSEFCLQPGGDGATRRLLFDCMIAGSVPVFFCNETAYDQYELFLPGEPESYSVYINHEEVRSGSSVIKQVLMRYSKEEIRRKREKVIEIISRIIYGEESPDFKDAFDIAVDGVLERIKYERGREIVGERLIV